MNDDRSEREQLDTELLEWLLERALRNLRAGKLERVKFNLLNAQHELIKLALMKENK